MVIALIKKWLSIDEKELESLKKDILELSQEKEELANKVISLKDEVQELLTENEQLNEAVKELDANVDKKLDEAGL